MLDHLGFEHRQEEKFFQLSKSPDRLFGPPRLLLSGYRTSDAEGRRQDHKVNHPPPSSGEVQNEWSHNSTHAVCLSGVDKDKFTLCTFHCVTDT